VHVAGAAKALADALASGTAVLRNLAVSYNPNISGESPQQLAAAALGSKSLEVLSEVPIKELREEKADRARVEREGPGADGGHRHCCPH